MKQRRANAQVIKQPIKDKFVFNKKAFRIFDQSVGANGRTLTANVLTWRVERTYRILTTSNCW